MVTLRIYGEKAKELRRLGAFGTYRADGMAFTITSKSVEGRDCIDLEIVEEPPLRESKARYKPDFRIGARHE